MTQEDMLSLSEGAPVVTLPLGAGEWTGVVVRLMTQSIRLVPPASMSVITQTVESLSYDLSLLGLSEFPVRKHKA
jgi:hypothetical protein